MVDGFEITLYKLYKKGANCLQLAPFGCGDLDRTNFYKFYGRFKEVGLLHVGHVFVWHQQFGLDVLLGIGILIGHMRMSD
ncbi:hypothetical protein ASC72_08350 [Flavobacterium sp. Root420]|nr:hypothetical protein ASC72_08350 [Flavobacterium sp. Root420]